MLKAWIRIVGPNDCCRGTKPWEVNLEETKKGGWASGTLSGMNILKLTLK